MAEYTDFARFNSNPNVLGYTYQQKIKKIPKEYLEPEAPFKYNSSEQDYVSSKMVYPSVAQISPVPLSLTNGDL